ncbi:MAG: hypothetical protein KF767_15810 [Bdellovibrionaceae bacterium]|nr:hypothetical protein [Pseudobdellovibrionaceae bacterium]
MKALLLGLSLVVLTAMGGTLYYFFQHAEDYQAASAERMKEAVLKKGEIAVTAAPEQTWSFSNDPEAWNFEVKGGLLEVRPPTPEPLPELQAGQNIQDLPEWTTVQKGLVEEIKGRLYIDSKSTAKLEILPPVPRVAR